MRLTTAKFFSPKGLPYSRVGVDPDVAVQVAARPVDGGAVPAAGDAALDAALETARRVVAATPSRTVSAHPAARPQSR